MTARRQLQIGIDARDLLVAQPAGVERVVHHFLDSLGRVGDPDHRYVLFVDDELPLDGLPRLPGEIVIEPIRFPRLQKLADVWIILQMRRCIAEHRLDAFFTPNSKLPMTATACFTTVHGLEWHRCPADFRRLERLKQRAWFRLCSRRSAGIVTFAKNTARDIEAFRPGCSIPTCVVPEGVDHRFRRLGENETSAEVLHGYGIREPFVLSVCTLEPRKNLDGLIRAFAIACAEHQLIHQLVLVGRPGAASTRIEAMIAHHGLEDRVRLTGYVSNDDLVQLYNQTDLFVYPLRYEGFGLPVLEAMACGTPVVTSGRGSLAEVGGDAVALVDPDDDRDIARVIAGTLRDGDERKSMREKGLRRACRFSWEEMTRTIVQFIDNRVRGLEATPAEPRWALPAEGPAEHHRS